ncbi:MAG TPA: methyltransferase domain-containing protein [Propionibacteriaceae bacterium]|nr:methyltransferase domain-containing protein [Propionibacteriaceae bacterium]
MSDREADADRLSAAALQAGDPTGWFEPLYAEAAQGRAVIPWDRGGPHPLLVEWAETRTAPAPGGRALVVGSGPGSDAAFLAGLGWAVTGFDVAPSAVAAAQHRFADAGVDFQVADVLDPPADWSGTYDLVLESYTVQALPVELRPTVISRVRGFVAPGGTLLVLAAAEDAHNEAGPPWPLTRGEIESFAGDGLAVVQIEELGTADARRWRAEFRRS